METYVWMTYPNEPTMLWDQIAVFYGSAEESWTMAEVFVVRCQELGYKDSYCLIQPAANGQPEKRQEY